ncbi:MAG: 5'/3'-nucleotidase SurE [Anaerolineae bacterium]|nr:5'/3'-nucleotidase SurE [Anaerolineae bacterium]
MHILVTNDDGVNAPGLLALAQAMRQYGTITVLAPDRNWSGGGHVKTLHRPLHVKETRLADGTLALAADGAPSDCVALATLGIVKEKIDLVVSGINPYGNMGHDVTYSGTVIAAMEAVISSTSGIAFSLAGNEHHDHFHYETAAYVAGIIIGRIIAKGFLLPDLLLNVNVPNLPIEKLCGIRITKQGMRVYNSQLDKRLDPRNAPYYWIGGDVPSGIPDEGTDFGMVAAGFVSITPLDLDLTDYRRRQVLSAWDWAAPITADNPPENEHSPTEPVHSFSD